MSDARHPHSRDPQRRSLAATVIIVGGSVLIVAIGLCTLGAVVNAFTGALAFYGSATPADPSFSGSFNTTTPSLAGAGSAATPQPTPIGSTVPPVPSPCCFNMTLGHDVGDNGQQLYIMGQTTAFYSYTDRFAYLVDMHGPSLLASNKPAGSSTFWLALLSVNAGGDMTPINKVEQEGGPSSTNATECANSFALVTLMNQEPAGQYEVQFLAADGTTRIADAIFDYYDEPGAG